MPRKRKRKDYIDPSRLHPKQAAGLTQGPHSLEEAKEQYTTFVPPDAVGGALRASEKLAGTRQPKPRFVAEEDNEAVWVDETTGVVRRDIVKNYTPDQHELLRQGRQCLMCDEPHPAIPFPDRCDLCGYGMRANQLRDYEREYQGEHFMGSELSLQTVLDEMDEKSLKREFDRKVLSGRSPMLGIHAKKN
jgi:hypothetical protein